MEYVKRLFYGILVLGLSIGILVLVSENSPVKNNILEASMSMFAEPLLALVPEGEDRQVLHKWYTDFINKAKHKEIPPEKVEEIACMILNAEKMDTTFSARDLTFMFDMAITLPDSIRLTDLAYAKKAGTPGVVVINNMPELPPQPPPIRYEQLGHKLQQMYQINNDLKILIRHHKPHRIPYEGDFVFSTDGGFHVQIDPTIKEKLDSLKDKKWTERLLRLKQKEIIQWRETDKQQEKLKQIQHFILAQKQYYSELKNLEYQIYLKTGGKDSVITIKMKTLSGDKDLETKEKDKRHNHERDNDMQ